MKAKQRKRNVVVSVLALAGLLAFSLLATGGSLEPSAPPGPTMKTLDEVQPRVPIHASDLPLTITEPNSYYLAENITFTDDANHVITIECNDVTIDLAGFTLEGPDSGTKSGIYMSERTNVEVRNGTVRDFYHGIYEASYSGKQHTVINVRAMSNEHYGIRLRGNGHLVKECTAAENSYHGIYAYIGCTVTGNTAYDNGGYGILTNSGCTVTGNTAYANGQRGISAGSGCTVTGNTAYGNGGNGISASIGSTVTGNTAYNNGDTGISAGSGGTVTGNTAYDNDYDGIYTGTGCTVTGNTAYSNNQSNAAGNGGIRVYSGCLVKGNTFRSNKENNIYVQGSGSAIEQNLVTDCSGGNGINFSSTGNFYANNRASGNGTDYAGDVPTGDGDGGGNVSF